MNRRDALKSGGSALLLASLFPRIAAARTPSDRLFFDLADIPRIRANAQTPLLKPTYDAWRAEPVRLLYDTLDKAVQTGEILNDMAAALEQFARKSTIYVVEPSRELRDALIHTIETIIDRPKWDYFVDGELDIGIMLGPRTVTRLLFAREALGAEMPAGLEDKMLDAIAEKGCLPIYRMVVGMDFPETVTGWGFDDLHSDTYDISLERWPEIFSDINLRAVPTAGLGLGALALAGRDPRAGLWLDTAISSSRHFLGLLSADGSYFEGVSYVDFSFRTLLNFLDAHQRVDGSIRWADEANFEGLANFMVTMQMGRRADGNPDIVNFSDAFNAPFPCIASWIAKNTGSGVAQFAVQELSRPGFFLDFVWYEPERQAEAPPERLKNALLDLDWVIARTGWGADDAVVAFRGGTPANHEHADRNSFIYKVRGERMLTDISGASYDWRQPKWLLRQTEAHNAVLIDGKGHWYHNGEEGTNAGKAIATIVRFEEDGDRVWWCSDVTHGYKLVDPDVVRVRRTVLFAKPDVVVLLDQVEKATRASTVEIRFFPENADGEARLSATDTAFIFERPKATLQGFSYARERFQTSIGALDLPPDLGSFPFAEVASRPNLTHEIVTTLVAGPPGQTTHIAGAAIADPDGWTIEVGALHARISFVDGGVLGMVPDVTWL